LLQQGLEPEADGDGLDGGDAQGGGLLGVVGFAEGLAEFGLEVLEVGPACAFEQKPTVLV
jgi:hypothetical protein